MITFKWFPDAAYWDTRGFETTLEHIANDWQSYCPLIVRTKEELDYLHGMGLMYGMDFQPTLYKTWVPTARGPRGTYFTVRGLPPS